MTPEGIDPATFRFIAQCLNHWATACPKVKRGHWNLKGEAFFEALVLKEVMALSQDKTHRE
jgi:DNA-binding ferritin-like protein